MNGGRLSRVTSKPFTRPHNVPNTTPSSSAKKPGTPLLAARLAMNNMDRIEIAPTDRSMPAVNTINVCPIANAAMIAVCWMMIDNRGGLGEPWVDDREHDHGDDQHQQWTDRRMRVQQMLNPLHRGLTP